MDSNAGFQAGDRVKAIGGHNRRRAGKVFGMVGVVVRVSEWDGVPAIYVRFQEAAHLGDLLLFRSELERLP